MVPLQHPCLKVRPFEFRFAADLHLAVRQQQVRLAPGLDLTVRPKRVRNHPQRHRRGDP